jgi:hypothetical protein
MYVSVPNRAVSGHMYASVPNRTVSCHMYVSVPNRAVSGVFVDFVSFRFYFVSHFIGTPKLVLIFILLSLCNFHNFLLTPFSDTLNSRRQNNRGL